MTAVELVDQKIDALTIMRGMCRRKIEELQDPKLIAKLERRIIEIEDELWSLEGERLIAVLMTTDPPRDIEI